MNCKNCDKKPVIVLESGVRLCKSCFIHYFEKKVFKTIRNFKLVRNHEKIGVAVSGGKDSLSCLNLLTKLAKKQVNVEIIPIAIDEGIRGYRLHTIKNAERFCKKINVKLRVYSFKKEFGLPLDSLLKKTKERPCTICGVLRRQLLNKVSRQLKLNKLATGHNLDDEAQSVLMNQFKRNVELSARLGPITGVIRDESFVPRIKPLYLMKEKETMLYAYLKNITTSFHECKNASIAYRNEVKNFLNDFEEKYPGTKYNIVKSFLEVLPLLKKQYKTNKAIKKCNKCKEPCSQDICQKCQILAKVKKP